ncbi:MAG: PilZ domain-containing protein [Phycisphaeraceae bacterium]|nr:PilZ domain-containing protein [Phycisphaeraceae bacterium]
MLNATLKLVDTASEIDALVFERRRGIRRPINGRVTAIRGATEHAITPAKIMSLQLVNISDTGLGVVTNEPMELGSHLTVMFPAHGPDGSCDATCHVVRCNRRAFGFEIGVKFDSRTAACA